MDCKEIFTSSYDPCDLGSTVSFYGAIFIVYLVFSIIYALAVFISYKTLRTYRQRLGFTIINLIFLSIFVTKNINLTNIQNAPYLWLEIAAGFVILVIIFGQHIYNRHCQTLSK
jgi:hypothetical protein